MIVIVIVLVIALSFSPFLTSPPSVSRGFGFVTFQDEDSLERALGEPNHEIGGKKVGREGRRKRGKLLRK